MNYSILTSIAIFYFGAIWGSFFVTLGLRYIDNTFSEDPIKGLTERSKCPLCKAPVSTIGLIPILGYFILKGRCPNCKNSISIIYPVFEFIYGLIVLLIISKLGLTPISIISSLLAGIGAAITIIDLKTMRIPDSLVIVFIFLSIYPAIYDGQFLENIFGLLFLGGFFLIIIFIFPGGFGGGDLKFAAAIGFNLGINLSIVALETALISGAIIGLIYGLISQKGLRIKIPFGPFLFLSYLIAILWGNDIFLLYMNYTGN
jgi:prepilin signal peptidase PulO-like enzyme (type II secretory pathway)